MRDVIMMIILAGIFGGVFAFMMNDAIARLIGD